MSVTEFRRTYFGTVLGYLWSLVRPLLLFAVLLFVFTHVFRVSRDEVPNYPVLLLLGIVLFSFFQEATTSAVTSVVAQEGIVRKTQFPRLVIPTTVVLTALFNLCLNLVVVFVFILAYGVDPMWTWLLFPVALLALFVLTTATSMLLSVLYVRFRDVAIIWSVVDPGPLLRDPGPLPDHLPQERKPTKGCSSSTRWRRSSSRSGSGCSNPTRRPPPRSSAAPSTCCPAVAIFVGVCFLGVWVFNRDAPRIAEEL